VISFSENANLVPDRFGALKQRCRKIKLKLQSQAIKLEAPGKEASSPNKQRLMRLSSELEKLATCSVKDYEAIINTFRELQKILDAKKEQDLHVLRALRFLPVLMEIYKKVHLCPKSELPSLLRILDPSVKILQSFCQLADNRTHLFLTNRFTVIIDLLMWCLNKPTKFIYSLGFAPGLFQIAIILLKHRLNTESRDFKESVVEYVFCCGFLQKIKQKFLTFRGGLDLSMAKGQVPLALVKSVKFLEVLSDSQNFRYEPHS